MLDLLRWLVAVELVGLAFLPLTMVSLRALPDRGYIFGKILGVLLVTYVAWLVGNVLPVVRSSLVPGIVVVLFAAAGWWTWRATTLAGIREAKRAIVIEEVLFIGGVLLLSVMRVNTFGSAVSHTEQFMDMALLNASFHSASYPALDPWMSGHSINYYYFGYLTFATIAKLSGVVPSVAYNLALSTVFGFVLAGSYSIAHAVTRRLVWPLLAPIFLAVIGNWHALLWTSGHGTACSSDPFWGSLWESSRVVGSLFTLAYWSGGPPWAHVTPCAIPEPTINEYPLFSFVLGDLHPHLIALPFTLLAIAMGVGILFSDRPFDLNRTPGAIGRLLLIAVAVGSLFMTNSWDFPTYLLVVGTCMTVRAYLHDDRPTWWQKPVVNMVVLGGASVLLFAPFYLHFRSLAHGIGRVTTPTDLYEFLQVFGLFVLIAGLFVFTLSLLLQPATEEDDVREEEGADAGEPVLALEHGHATFGFASGSNRSGLLTGIGVVVLGILALLLHLAVLSLLLFLGISALVVMHRVLNTEEPNRSDAVALALVVIGCLVAALPEVIYLRDAFDNGSLYRMNTVFKFYYQAWTLLSLAGAYGVYRIWSALRTTFAPMYSWLALAAIAVGVVGAGTYTTYAFSAQPGDTRSRSLDGAAWIADEHRGDSAGMVWLRDHAPNGSIIVEAVGGDYSYAARMSTFTGLPTVMGWVGHEGQWRKDDGEIMTRSRDVGTIYTTASVKDAKQLLRRYGVRYVIVGEQEQTTYAKNAAQLTKFGGFMRIAYRTGGLTIYTW